MARFAVGDKVFESGRAGRVTALRPKGMVDVQFEDMGYAIRRPESALIDRDLDQDHMRRWRQRVYEGLVKQELKAKEFYTPDGRIDVLALQSGRFTREDVDRLVSRAFGATTRQAHKPLSIKGSKVTGGWLVPGTQKPTGRTRAKSAEDRSEEAKHAERLAQYELTLELRRKTKKNPKSASDVFFDQIEEVGGNVKKGVRLVGRGQIHEAAKHSVRSSGKMLRSHGKVARSALSTFLNPSEFEGLVQYGKEIKRRRFAKKRSTHLKGVARAGESLEIQTARSKHTELTDTSMYAVDALHDPDMQGYFVLVYDPRRKTKIDRALEKIGGWKFAPEITGSGLVRGTEVGVKRGAVVRSAPAVHRVVPHGRGHHSVVGPEAKTKDVYSSKKDAEARAKQLDIEAHRLMTPSVHSVSQIETGAFVVVGPEADDYDFPNYTPMELRALRMQAQQDAATEGVDYGTYEAEMMKHRREMAEVDVKSGPTAAERQAEFQKYYREGRGRSSRFAPLATSSEVRHRGKQAPQRPERTAWDALSETFYRGPFATKEEAERAAAKLDKRVASKGVVPLVAKRTKPGMSAMRAAEIAQQSIAALLDAGVYLTSYPHANAFGAFLAAAANAASETKRAASPSALHKLSYAKIRSILAESGYNDAQIAKIIEAEKHNREMIEWQTQKQVERERSRVGKRPGEYIERKETE